MGYAKNDGQGSFILLGNCQIRLRALER